MGLSTPLTLPLWRQWSYLLLAFILVAFGQPAWSPPLALLTALGGFALFWRAMWCWGKPKHRFLVAFLWFTAVQLVQLSWLISHPYIYIYAVYLFFALAIGLQFACVSLLVTPRRVLQPFQIFMIASVWTLMEWSRLFFLSGFTFNPVSLALSTSLYASQTASLWGIFGLSFCVLLTNLFALRAWLLHLNPSTTTKGLHFTPILSWAIIAALPYVYGALHLSIQEKNVPKDNPSINVLLVQTGFPAEELMAFSSTSQAIQQALNQWKQVLHILSQHRQQPVDLIAMPEGLVHYGTYYAIYPYKDVLKAFQDILGADSLQHLPPLAQHLAMAVPTEKGSVIMVNNAFWAQAISNLFHTGVIVGLEDHEEIAPDQIETYNAALTFLPDTFIPQRYEKRVLLPLGEYMPFTFCQSLAAKYGIGGSFSCGTAPKVLQGTKIPITLSICYEETFGHLMRENRLAGGELLVNITNDVWYPNSKLPQQHFDLARLRTIENGIPLVRACNTGVTSAIDSLGRTIAILDDGKNAEWLSAALFVQVPTYTYTTLYTYVGDYLIISLCVLFILIALIKNRKTDKIDG